MSRRKLTEREHRMWSRVAKSVRPIEKDPCPSPEPDTLPPISPPQAAPPEPVWRPHARPRANADDLDKLLSGFASLRPMKSVALPDIPAIQLKPGIPADRGGERKVRRGRVPIGSTLDLHGHTQETGRAALLQFVSFHRGQGETSVLIITGKGRDGDGILRRRFFEWISEPDMRIHVSGYARANQKHGGDGAFYLFLKQLTV